MCLNLVGLRACLNLVGLRKIEFGRNNQQTKSRKCTNPPQAGIASVITSSMYGKGHVALNKVNSYENQNFHSGTPRPFNKPNTQAADGTSAQPYGIYLPCRLPDHHTSVNIVDFFLLSMKL
ncbi:protein lingerer-like isoform 2-T2 [Glossina fuscipes fuscipes]